jgi:hypothetical protein
VVVATKNAKGGVGRSELLFEDVALVAVEIGVVEADAGL